MNENRQLRCQLENAEKKCTTTDCGLCHAILSNEELNKHVCFGHDEIACDYCMASFKSTIDLRLHFTEIEHSNVTFYKCEMCEKAFPMAVLLQYHLSSEQSHLHIQPITIDSSIAKSNDSVSDLFLLKNLILFRLE